MAESRIDRSANRTNLALMAVAVLLLAGFFVWITVASEPSTLAIVEQEEEQAFGDDDGVLLTLGEFGVNPDNFLGERIRMSDLSVTSLVGPEAFWVDLPSGIPYLIKVNPRVLQDGLALTPGQTISVAGFVRPMSDSVVAAWQRSGAIQTESQRMEAEFATSFLEVDRAMPGGRNGAGN